MLAELRDIMQGTVHIACLGSILLREIAELYCINERLKVAVTLTFLDSVRFWSKFSWHPFYYCITL